MGRSATYSPGVRERAVRMVWELGADHPSQWAAIETTASTLGCTSETRRRSRVVTETRWGARQSLHPFRAARLGQVNRTPVIGERSRRPKGPPRSQTQPGPREDRSPPPRGRTAQGQRAASWGAREEERRHTGY
jgi:hypothetical protein